MKTHPLALVTLVAVAALVLVVPAGARKLHAPNQQHRSATTPVVLFSPALRPAWLGPLRLAPQSATTASTKVVAADTFDWRDAAIGASTVLGLVVLAGGAVLATHHAGRRHHGAVHA